MDLGLQQCHVVQGHNGGACVSSHISGSWAGYIQDESWGLPQTPVMSPGSHRGEGAIVSVKEEEKSLGKRHVVTLCCPKERIKSIWKSSELKYFQEKNSRFQEGSTWSDVTWSVRAAQGVRLCAGTWVRPGWLSNMEPPHQSVGVWLPNPASGRGTLDMLFDSRWPRFFLRTLKRRRRPHRVGSSNRWHKTKTHSGHWCNVNS